MVHYRQLEWKERHNPVIGTMLISSFEGWSITIRTVPMAEPTGKYEWGVFMPDGAFRTGRTQTREQSKRDAYTTYQRYMDVI